MDLGLRLLGASWDVLCASAPYMLFGFFIAGLLKAFLPDDLIARHLGRGAKGGLFKAAAFGVPIPLCSCGVLPAAAGIRQQGAGRGPTAAFLISTPETGVDSIAVTWALLDPVMAVVRPLSAFVTAMVTGGVVQALDTDEKEAVAPGKGTILGTTPIAQEGCGCGSACGSHAPKASSMERLRSGMQFAFGDLFGDISGWFLIGVSIAGAISVFVSPDLVHQYLGNPVVAMLAMLVVAVPLYVCATASTPIAAALVMKGISPGAALVFLMAGPATNAAGLTVVAKILGKKAAGVYLGGIVVCSFVIGLLVDLLYARLALAAVWQTGMVEGGPGAVGILSALTLLGLAIYKRIPLGEKQDTACGCGHC